MGLIRFVAEQREQQVLAAARRHLRPGEEVLHWVRTRRVSERGTGFLYLTESRCIIAWEGRDEPQSFAWEEVGAWGIDTSPRIGPILAIEGRGETAYVLVPSLTHSAASDASTLLRAFARRAPESRRVPQDVDGKTPFKRLLKPKVERHRRSLSDHTKRVAVTVVGLSLVVVGVFLLVLPGPGLLTVVAGLAILGNEYDWAQDALQWAKERSKQAARRVSGRSDGRSNGRSNEGS